MSIRRAQLRSDCGEMPSSAASCGTDLPLRRSSSIASRRKLGRIRGWHEHDPLAEPSSDSALKCPRNSEDVVWRSGLGLTYRETDPLGVVPRTCRAGLGAPSRSPWAAGLDGRDFIGTCLRHVPRHCFVRPPRPVPPAREKGRHEQHDESRRIRHGRRRRPHDTHDAAALDERGRLGTRTFATTPRASARSWPGLNRSGRSH